MIYVHVSGDLRETRKYRLCSTIFLQEESVSLTLKISIGFIIEQTKQLTTERHGIDLKMFTSAACRLDYGVCLGTYINDYSETKDLMS